MSNYKQVLKLAPPHDSMTFIDFLRDKNNIVYESECWILIENIKYHVTDHPHYTLFPKEYAREWADLTSYEVKEFRMIMNKYDGWFKYENTKEKKTIDRLHFHVVRDYTYWLKMMYKFEVDLQVKVKLKNHKELATFKGKFKNWLKKNNVKIVAS